MIVPTGLDIYPHPPFSLSPIQSSLVDKMIAPSCIALSLLASLVSSAVATPGTVHLGFTKTKRVVDLDELIRRSTTGTVDADLTQVVEKNEYLINITVGTPPQNLAVTLDTGSSDLWIPAVDSQQCEQGKCDAGSFDPTKSSTYVVVGAGQFNITYAQANDVDAGDYATDDVTVAGATIKALQFGLASTETTDTHGVMGVSYPIREAIVGQGGDYTPYPNILDQMVTQGIIQRRAYSLWLNDVESGAGSILFGGIDSTKYEGSLIALPIQEASDTPGNISEFNVALTSVSFTDPSGTKVLSADGMSVAALLDSGTTATYLPNDVFTALANGLGALSLSGTDAIIVPCSLATSNATIDYGFGGQGGPRISVPLSGLVGQQIIPPADFSDPSGACSIDLGPPQSANIILGDSFLRSAYVVYDIENNLVALAPAKYNVTSSSIQVIPSGTGFPGVSSTATASASDLDTAATSMAAAPTALESGSTVLAGTPTFSAEATGAGGSGGSSSSKGMAQPRITGAVGAAALFGGAAAIMNM